MVHRRSNLKLYLLQFLVIFLGDLIVILFAKYMNFISL